jgi:hypothetical protein
VPAKKLEPLDSPVSDANLTIGKGVAPTGGEFTLAGEVRPSIDQAVSFELPGGQTFRGVVKSWTYSRDRSTTRVQVADYRDRLRKEHIAGMFNIVKHVKDDPETTGIDRARLYEHLLPGNVGTWTVTRTRDPMSAMDVLDATLGEFGWSIRGSEILNTPVFSLDWSTGEYLDTILSQILQKLGLQAWIVMGETRSLEVGVRGVGDVPGKPAGTHVVEVGATSTDTPTRVTVVGDRELHQDLNVPFVPDWNRAWEDFWLEERWLTYVDQMFGPYENTVEGRSRQAIKARTVTVREVAAALGGNYADARKYSEINRMDIPAWIYREHILWKAYRVSAAYRSHDDLTPQQMELHSGLLAEVQHSGSTGGEIIYVAEEGGGKRYEPGTSAFVIAKGMGLRAWDPSRDGNVSAAAFADAREVWTTISDFTIDSDEDTLYFKEPLFVPGQIADGKGLFIFPNQAGGLDIEAEDEALVNVGVQNPDVELTPAEVKASVVWKRGRFIREFGTGERRARHYESGLTRHMLYGQGGVGEEVTYFDGETAEEKAAEIEKTITGLEGVGRPTEVSVDSWTTPNYVPRLSGAVESLSISFSSRGYLTTIKLDDNIDRVRWESSMELVRRSAAGEVYPGQEDLRQETRAIAQLARLKAAVLVENSGEQRPTSLTAAAQRPVTAGDVGFRRLTKPADRDVLAGEVLFTDSSGSVVDIAAPSLAFGGVAIAGSKFPTVGVATQGIVPVRVQGPFNPGDVVGCEDGEAFARVGGTKPVGVINHHRPYVGTNVITVPVRLGAGGSSSAELCWEWKPVPASDAELGDAEQPFLLGVLVGTVNGVLLPVNTNEIFKVGPNTETYFWVDCEVAADGKVSTVKIDRGESFPDQPESPGPDLPPERFYQGLFKVVAGDAGIDWVSTYRNIFKRESFDLRVYVTDIVYEPKLETFTKFRQIGVR